MNEENGKRGVPCYHRRQRLWEAGMIESLLKAYGIPSFEEIWTAATSVYEDTMCRHVKKQR